MSISGTYFIWFGKPEWKQGKEGGCQVVEQAESGRMV